MKFVVKRLHVPTRNGSPLAKKLIQNIGFESIKLSTKMNDKVEELYTIVNNLVRENEKIKEELRQLRQLITTTQPKKSNQLFTNTPIPKMVFHEWVKTLKVTPKHLERIFVFDMMEGLKSCLQECITTEGVLNIPIRTSPERRHVFYIYDSACRYVRQSDARQSQSNHHGNNIIRRYPGFGDFNFASESHRLC